MSLYNRLRGRPVYVRLFWTTALLMLWECTARLSEVSAVLLPASAQVARVLWDSLVRGDLFYQTLFSLSIIVQGMAVGCLLAMVFALVSMRFPVAGDLVTTVSSIAHPLPGIAVLPLVIMWFGTGSGAIVALIVHSCLWPVLLNLLAGFRATSPVYTDVGRNLSMKPAEITFEILLPASFAHLVSGVKIGWARAWRALISAEMVFGALGAKGGVGWYIFKQRTFMNTAGLFAGVIVVIIIGVAAEGLFDLLEKHTVQKWGMAQPS